MDVTFERGTRLGIDVGRVRVGVAISDPDGILATPLVTLQRDYAATDGRFSADISEIARLVGVHRVVEVVVGLPVRLTGDEGVAARGAREYAQLLAGAVAPIPIALSDERMSTVVAARRLAERGVRGKRQRAVVDQAAAVEILQGWLDAHRRRVQ
ncbi:MAG TPA: Holliday junction resolvase RuvX [Micromonosporaceae bacterium]|jgi:putative Holliday junction resolvase|nr:Holliday junction resolvase RuvX [Micromonosporaceae bacterium]